MPTKENVKEKEVFIHPGFNPDNSVFHPILVKGADFSGNNVVMHRHMERDGNGIKIVEDGFVDEDALIQSEKCNAGLENIIRLQTMRYGTIENAIKRNEAKQVFADVSKIPTSIGEQAQYVEEIQKDVDKLCKELGITKEELLKSNQATLSQLYEAKAKAKAATAPANAGEGESK